MRKVARMSGGAHTHRMTMPEIPGNTYAIELHHRLRIAREKAGLSQAELAEAIDVSRRSMTHYEAGEIKPKRHVILAWALRTGASSEWLVTGATPEDLDDEATVTYSTAA